MSSSPSTVGSKRPESHEESADQKAGIQPNNIVFEIDGIPVYFPYEPYPTQLEYMRSVIVSLRTGENALLESPTGTGKTLCLLCASLAWLRYEKERRKASGPMGGSSSDMMWGEASRGKKSDSGLKIFYTSRTHSQLAQVIREFKKTPYVGDMQMAVLGSREHLCVHAGVSAMPSSVQGQQCAVARQDHRCRFFKGLQPFRQRQDVQVATNEVPNVNLFDIEELHLVGSREGFCPYFYERQMAESADIIFLPYQYVFDRALHSQLPVTFSADDSILILDEAHNIPSVLSKSGSVSLSPTTMSCAISDIDRAISLTQHQMEQSNKQQQQGGAYQQHGNNTITTGVTLVPGKPLPSLNTTSSGGGGVKSTGRSADTLDTQINFEEAITVFSTLKLLLVNLEDLIHEEPFKHNNNRREAADGEEEVPKPPLSSLPPLIDTSGMYMMKFLAQPGLQINVGSFFDTSGHMSLSSLLLTAQRMVMMSSLSGGAAVSGASYGQGLSAVHDFLSVVFTTAIMSHESIHMSCRFVLEIAVKYDKRSTNNSNNHQGTDGAPSSSAAIEPTSCQCTLNFWCLDVSIPMSNIASTFRNMLLTSGTLSPMEHFAAELGCRFGVKFCGKHVVKISEQVHSVCLTRGVDGEVLNSSYAFRTSRTYFASLGKSILNIASNVPDGMLVFFPSYGAMNTAVDIWKTSADGEQQSTLWGNINIRKTVFIEPQSSGDLSTIIDEFQKTATNSKNGALLLAVARGKVSEGVDFADRHARCVVVCGIPFANHGDLFIQLKKKFLTSVSTSRPRVGGKLFTGDDWYRNEALRCVNQSIGRVIRHKDDFGSIILADERFKNHLESLSRWVTHDENDNRVLTVADSFIDCYRPMTQFFLKKAPRNRKIGFATNNTGTENRMFGNVLPTATGSGGPARAATNVENAAKALAYMQSVKSTPVARDDSPPPPPSSVPSSSAPEVQKFQPSSMRNIFAKKPTVSTAPVTESSASSSTVTHITIDDSAIAAPITSTSTAAPVAASPKPATTAMGSKEFLADMRVCLSKEEYAAFRGTLQKMAEAVKTQPTTEDMRVLLGTVSTNFLAKSSSPIQCRAAFKEFVPRPFKALWDEVIAMKVDD